MRAILTIARTTPPILPPNAGFASFVVALATKRKVTVR